MDAEINLFISLLTEPVNYIVEPSRRLYWLFILSALVMASIAVTVQQKRFDVSQQLRALTNRHYWLNSSSLTDIGLLFTNNAIRVIILIPLLGSHLAATILVGSALQSSFGDAPNLALPTLLIGFLYTFTFFICEDFSRFGLHLALHKVPWLWRFHRVHHSATTLTPITVHRVHPLEMALYYLRGLIVFGLVSGVFIYLFRGQLHGWEILGVDCLGFLFNFFGANLRHSPIRLSFGALEKWLISPAQHQIHHSNLPQHHDKNFGTCLAIWDRLCDSWVSGRFAGQLRFGLN